MSGSNMRDFKYKLVRLANGTFSIHSLAEKETFHPVVGPVAEAQALYVQQLKLRERLRASRGRVCHLGRWFGSGRQCAGGLRRDRDGAAHCAW